MTSQHQPIKVAVLGIGMSATVFHIPFILSLPKLFTLHSIFERKSQPAPGPSIARGLYANLDKPVKVVNTLEQVLKDDEVDCVFISTVNDTHYEYTKASLDAGKHVVVEKPITPTFKEARELAALAKTKGLVLAVYQSRRFDSDYLTVKKLIEDGAFGELSEFESHYDRFKNEANAKVWKEKAEPGSGAAYDLGSHLIDQVLSLFGKPDSVTAILRNSRSIGDANLVDSFQIFLQYKPTDKPGRTLPLLATARGATLSHASPQLRYAINGTKASFIKHGIDAQEDQLKAGGAKAVESAGFAEESEKIWGTLYTKGGSSQVKSERGAYQSWFENVAQAIQAKDPSLLLVTPEQAALVIEVVEAAVKSAQEGKTVTF